MTFVGSKSPGWRDDVTFHASVAQPRPQREPNSDPEEGESPECDGTAGQSEPPVTVRGSFWRNLNRDRGSYTLKVKGEGGGGKGGEVAVLDLSWDRWDNEVLLLKERGQSGLRFEGGSRSIKPRKNMILILRKAFFL